MKILIIDDSKFSRMQTKNILKKIEADFQLIEADRALSGNHLFDQENPDITIVDLIMPEQKGDAVIQHVRAKDDRSFVAVLSANIQEKIKKELLSLGADLFIEKPVNLEKLKKMLEAYKNKLETL